MNSALLLTLNAGALATLVMFHFQTSCSDEATQASQAISRPTQQHPVRVSLGSTTQPSTYLAHATRAGSSSERWIF